jgi:hypothetical protein
MNFYILIWVNKNKQYYIQKLKIIDSTGHREQPEILYSSAQSLMNFLKWKQTSGTSHCFTRNWNVFQVTWLESAMDFVSLIFSILIN